MCPATKQQQQSKQLSNVTQHTSVYSASVCLHISALKLSKHAKAMNNLLLSIAKYNNHGLIMTLFSVWITYANMLPISI